MANFITVIEYAKKLDLDKYKFIYEEPFIYRQTLSFYNYSSYFTEIYGAANDVNSVKRNIISVTVNNIDYALKTSYADMEADDESFYFDILNQVLYIHLNHAYHIFAYEIYAGMVVGFANKGNQDGSIKYYNDIPYLPLVKKVPSLNISIKPGVYRLLAFFGGSVTLDNLPNDFIDMAGYWDAAYLDNPQNNLINLLYGNVDDTYASLLQFAQFKITSSKINLREAQFRLKDRRSLLTQKLPTEYFNNNDYPDIDEDLIGEVVPLAFGVNFGVPGICIDTATGGAKTFKVPAIDTLFDVWVQDVNEIWERVTPTAIDDANGLITIAEADIYEGGVDTGNLLKVKVDGCFIMPITYCNPGDIIKYILDEYCGVNYDASNYDMAEWQEESDYLEDVGIYIDEKKTIYEIIEILQDSSNFGFYFEHIYNTRTLRIDNPNRAVARIIQAVENFEEQEYEIKEDDYFSKVSIKYRPDRGSGRYRQYTNSDYEEAVLREYGNQEIESDKTQLQSAEEQCAIDRSIIIMEDRQKARFLTSCSLFGLEAFAYRVLDIISIDFGSYYITRDRDLDSTDRRDREFIGVQRCKIISVNPDLQKGKVVFGLRECPESAEVETVIDNKNWFFDHMLYYSSTYFLMYWNLYLGNGEISAVIDGGEKVISVGNNAGIDDRLWTYHSKLIPYDSTKLYEVRAIIKRTAGAGKIYVGVEGVNADGVTMENVTGADQHASQHYFAAENIDPTSDWVEYKGYFSGAAAAGNGGQHNNIYDPGTVHEDAAYIRGMFILNEITIGTTLIKEFQIRKITN